ncbi:uncharacterized protein LOC103483872 [Cucumis melo]|uniref:Chaperone protein DnaJ n=1 Tax=Cucumis melo TaxID=3656 RepID=A0A1S3AXH7_CUCME|nr:uncharacterized protein LOC103483872 [Cucumis melo]
MGPDSDFKSHLAYEISSFSSLTVSCPHRHFSPPFIDWYRLFGVQQDAPIDFIRSRYLKLALQLHPDKNSHPKAEIAFKLVSEGYGCLSDNVKRRAFDLDRKNKFCPDCNTIPYRNFTSATNLNALNIFGGFHNNIHGGGLRDMKERLREEANVIENCLRANNSSSTTETSLFNPPGCNMFHHRNYKETPIFNPSDYVCQGYPHFRTRIHPKARSFRCFRSGNALKYEQGRGKYEYPVFEISSSRSESFLLQKQSAFVYSNVNKSSHW